MSAASAIVAQVAATSASATLQTLEQMHPLQSNCCLESQLNACECQDLVEEIPHKRIVHINGSVYATHIYSLNGHLTRKSVYAESPLQ